MQAGAEGQVAGRVAGDVEPITSASATAACRNWPAARYCPPGLVATPSNM